MPREVLRFPLLASGPGTRREVLAHRFGRTGQGRKAYMHAALHADETPGLLVLHHLIQLLDAAEDRGEILGEIVILPYANPIGLAQWVNGDHNGRYEMGGGGNFNRNWPDLFEALAEAMAGRLTDRADANVALIRAELHDLLAAREPRNELESLRLTLARLAMDADLVLDIHCDDDSLLHLFLIPEHWPQGADLAADLGAPAVMLAADSGGGSFDEACSTLWTRLQAHFPEHPIPAACLAATVELRGQADVSDSIALADAQALFRTLQRQGYVAGDPGPRPELLCEATPLEATDSVRAPAAGVLSYAVELGQQVEKGDLIAWLIDPAAENPAEGRIPIHCRGAGLVLSRRSHKFLQAGQAVAKIVGSEPLEHRQGSYLLED